MFGAIDTGLGEGVRVLIRVASVWGFVVGGEGGGGGERERECVCVRVRERERERERERGCVCGFCVGFHQASRKRVVSC